MPDEIVTRFAPSPTGYLHVGGARTAVFNWLWARRNAGRFILRIEDTDVKRNSPAAMRQVIEDLRWLGIEWDEGPEVGGPNGPYLQSQRREIYQRYIEQLINRGQAYYCFDTAEELEAMRREAFAAKRNFRYPRPGRFADSQQVAAARSEARPVTVRFAVPEAELIVQDVVRGQIRFSPEQFGDFIIQKSDGFPTYNFACVVDDALMEVTDVIRGQEHLMNTPIQQLLQDALGFSRPRYAHMSVTVSQGGGKLSKRERAEVLKAAIAGLEQVDIHKLAEVGATDVGRLESFLAGQATPEMEAVNRMAAYVGVELPEVNVVDFFRSGYVPEALVNFLALLGWNPGDGREIMSVAELIESFDISRLTKSNSLFDRKKLAAFNTEHLRRSQRDVLSGHFRRYLESVASPVAGADDALLDRLLEVNAGARTLSQVERKSRFLFLSDEQIEYDDKAVKKVLLKKNGLEMLRLVRGRLAELEEVSEKAMERLLRQLAAEQGVGLGKVAQPLRVALCGTTVSLPIFDSVVLLGMEITLARIDKTLERFGRVSKTEGA